MFKHYLLTAFRNLSRQKVYSFINIFGLSIGLAACLLIFLFIQDERSYEDFHTKSDSIYRLACEYFLPNDGGSEKMAAIGPAVSNFVLQDYPQVEAAIRVRQRSDQVIEHPTTRERFYETIYFADSNIFEVFDLPLLAGNPQTALKDPLNVVISRSLAEKYFGQTNALNQTLKFPEDTVELTVSGVMENMPGNTHLRMDVLIPHHLLERFGVFLSSWWSFNTQTYLLMAENADIEAFKKDIKRISARHIPDQEEGSGYRQEYFLQPIKSIHLYSKLRGEVSPNSDAKYVYIFSAIGLFVLLLACVNFMNLATARATLRAKEIGLRKVVGANRSQLITQLLGESVIVSVFAMLLALVFVVLAIPILNELTGKSMEFNLADRGLFMLACLGFSVAIGMLAGVYPAFFLSAFRPSITLKGKISPVSGGNRLRKSLVIFQFVISTVLIASTLIIYQQLNHMQEADLGFQKDQVIFLPTHGGVGTAESFVLLKKELEDLPYVQHTSVSSQIPGHSMNNNVVRKGWTDDAEWSDMRYLSVDYDFIDLYGIKLIAGRSFDETYGTDEAEGFILNESGVKRLGWKNAEEAIGQKLKWQRKLGRVIGVVEDFYFMSVQNPVEPFIFVMDNHRVGYLSLRISGEDYAETLSQIEKKYGEIMPGRSFEYQFLDEDFDRQYNNEKRFGKLFIYLSSLAIFIACLGLFGLAAFSISQRTKEIAIRKILGATLSDLSVLLASNFLVLVLVAFALSIPLAWWGMHAWLEAFAYKIEPNIISFLAAGLIALGIASLTISFHVLKGARQDPAHSLRNE